jgi:hypothetical protein
VTRREAILLLEEEHGIDDDNRQSIALDVVVPGICLDCGGFNDEMEPDAIYDCEECGGEETVQSYPILLGVI